MYQRSESKVTILNKNKNSQYIPTNKDNWVPLTVSLAVVDDTQAGQ